MAGSSGRSPSRTMIRSRLGMRSATLKARCAKDLSATASTRTCASEMMWTICSGVLVGKIGTGIAPTVNAARSNSSHSGQLWAKIEMRSSRHSPSSVTNPGSTRQRAMASTRRPSSA